MWFQLAPRNRPLRPTSAAPAGGLAPIDTRGGNENMVQSVEKKQMPNIAPLVGALTELMTAKYALSAKLNEKAVAYASTGLFIADQTFCLQDDQFYSQAEGQALKAISILMPKAQMDAKLSWLPTSHMLAHSPPFRHTLESVSSLRQTVGRLWNNSPIHSAVARSHVEHQVNAFQFRPAYFGSWVPR
jgi:hypothetical protein